MAQQGFSSSLPGWRDGCERAQPGVAHAVGHDAPLRGPAACIAVPMVRGPRLEKCKARDRPARACAPPTRLLVSQVHGRSEP